MEPIKIKGNPRKHFDDAGKPRWRVHLEDGRQISKPRWMMMNFLHTTNIPKKIHVHHKNEITDDDRIENFQLITNVSHAKLHIPRDDSRFGVSATDYPVEYGRLSATAYYVARKDDPEFQKKRKGQVLKYSMVKRQDPKYMAKNAAYSREYRRLHKDDPIYKTKSKAYAKEYYQKMKGENHEV